MLRTHEEESVATGNQLRPQVGKRDVACERPGVDAGCAHGRWPSELAGVVQWLQACLWFHAALWKKRVQDEVGSWRRIRIETLCHGPVISEELQSG